MKKKARHPPHGTKRERAASVVNSQRTTEGETVRAHTNRTIYNSSHAEDDATRDKNADASTIARALILSIYYRHHKTASTDFECGILAESGGRSITCQRDSPTESRSLRSPASQTSHAPRLRACLGTCCGRSRAHRRTQPTGRRRVLAHGTEATAAFCRHHEQITGP